MTYLPISQTVKSLLAALAFALLSSVALANEGGELIAPSGANVDDQQSLQRGAKYFVNYCMSCHNLKYMRYSRLAADLDLSEQQVMDALNPGGNKFGETMTVAMAPADAALWFGKAPPDLSLTTRYREGGADWVYSYLKSFYVDPKRPSGWNNLVFPSASMPHVLWELQGNQAAVYDTVSAKNAEGELLQTQKFSHFELIKPGKLDAKAYDQVARDIATFLEYVGEPAVFQRKDVGWKVILFLAFFTFITWLLKKEYWSDVH